MPVCEMCGKDTSLVRTEVEGTELKLCQDCTKYGTVKEYRAPKSIRMARNFYPKSQGVEYEIVPNYSKILQKARTSKDLDQEKFAKSINEKVSVVQKWEAGNLKPNVDTAKKLERQLNIKLLKVTNNSEDGALDLPTNSKKSAGEPTLGDFVKVRKRKK